MNKLSIPERLRDRVKPRRSLPDFVRAPTAKTTTFWEQNGGSATVAGVDFMKATWSVWFGKIDPPSIGDRLIANL